MGYILKLHDTGTTTYTDNSVQYSTVLREDHSKVCLRDSATGNCSYGNNALDEAPEILYALLHNSGAPIAA